MAIDFNGTIAEESNLHISVNCAKGNSWRDS